MNEAERVELERLKQRLLWLQQELSLLSGQLTLLEQRLKEAEPRPERPAPARPATSESPRPAIEAGAKTQAAGPPPELLPSVPSAAQKPLPASPPPIPPVLAKAVVSAAASEAAATLTAGLARDVTEAGEPRRPAPERSLEMRLGTYWLGRIGIVLVLTALVFFGNLAYQKYISQLGPGGKVALLYLASGILLGAGAWWQRKAARKSLQNYAQVVFAGGLAAFYFTTYAAHHLEQLRIIADPVLDGLLLLGWAGFMVWEADRKKSEVLALFAVGLGYYTAIITRVGLFTLYSNLVLTVAAVFFLVRNRWAVLSFASLAATYAAYAFWRFFNGSQWHWATAAEGLWTGTYFLISYWLVFTAAVFLCKDQKFSGENRAVFLTANNGAFFTLFLLTMLQVHHGGFWKFALSYGAVLLVLAELARRVLATERLAKDLYLTQGLLLVTAGLISHPDLAGLHLALVLAAEAVVLLMLGQQRKDLILLTGAYIAAGLAVGWGIDGMRPMDRSGLWLAVGLGALMMVNILLVHRWSGPAGPGMRLAGGDAGAPSAEHGDSASTRQVVLRPGPSYFTVLALVVWLAATWDNTTHPHFPLVLGVEALVLTLSIYVLGVREITLLSQSYLVLAQLAWVLNWFDPDQLTPWWSPLLLIAISLALSHWWQRQKVLGLPSGIGLAWQALYALAIVAVLSFWLSAKVQAPTWLALTSLLAVGFTAYGVFTRAWWLAAFGQIFMVISAAQFVAQLWQGKPAWAWPLAPIGTLGLLSFATVRWFASRPGNATRVRGPLLQLTMVYRWVALGMSLWWVCEYIAARERIWVLALLGFGVFLWAGWRRSREALAFGAVFTLTGLGLFWLPLLEAPAVYWLDLVAILVLLGQQQIVARRPDRYPLERGVPAAVITVGGLSLWLFLSRWVLEQASGFYLTASWSLLALAFFTLGIVLRERVYRWLGLGVLAAALGRVVVFDVWKLETLYRILSFMALGIVLLVLGFIYNKYQEKIKEWL